MLDRGTGARRGAGAAAGARARVVGVLRGVVGTSVLVVLALSYAEQRAAGRGALVDFLGYFTNRTSLLGSVLLVATGGLAVVGRPAPAWLTVARGVATACLLVVALVHNLLAPGAGALVWAASARRGLWLRRPVVTPTG